MALDAIKLTFFVYLFSLSGKPSNNRPVRLPGQILHAALQEWEFTELQSQHDTAGLPLYCRGAFDAITMGEVQMSAVRKETRAPLMLVTKKKAAKLNFLNVIHCCSGGITSLFGLFVSTDQDGMVLVFRGSMYWSVSAGGSVSGPLPLRQRWSDLPQAIEAATFSPSDSKWYFFKGTALLSSLKRLISERHSLTCRLVSHIC